MAQRSLQKSVSCTSVKVSVSLRSKWLTAFGHLDLDTSIRIQAYRTLILTQRHIPAQLGHSRRAGQPGLKHWADLSYPPAVSPKVANGNCSDFQLPFRTFCPLLFRNTNRLRWENLLWVFSFCLRCSFRRMIETMRVSVRFERFVGHWKVMIFVQ